MPVIPISVLSYRHIRRYREIISVLAKYGFGEILAKLDLRKYLGRRLPLFKTPTEIAALSHWERVRLALEELGPTFIKFGQIMSTRPDMVPRELIEELEKLQERVPPFPTVEAKRIIEEELGRQVEDIFADFDEGPIASASIAQVYKAVLRSGEMVAVKIQRPGIARTIEVDLEIMKHLATLIERHIKGLDTLRPVAMVEEFARVIRKELDFGLEAAHIRRFARNFHSDRRIHVPHVYNDLSSAKVLTMEFIQGYKVSDITTSSKCEEQNINIDPKVVASRCADLILTQVFEHGFFHADPHPGNIRVLKGNVICFLDYGMMGSLSLQHRDALADMLIGITTCDVAKITKTIQKLSGYTTRVNRESLEQDISDILDIYAYRSLKELEIGNLFQNIMNTIVKYRLNVPRDFYLLAKALVTMEGIGRSLDPEFNAVEHARPFARRMVYAKMIPGRLTRDLISSLLDTRALIHEFPSEAREILALVREGELQVKFRHDGLEPMLKTIDKGTNRISSAIVLAALIIGSSLIVLSGVPPRWHDIPLIGLIGFMLAGLIGFMLLFVILRDAI